MRGGIAVTTIVLGATASTAFAARPQIGVEVLPKSTTILPVKLTCPKARVTCAGTASFKGSKEYKGKIYRLEAAPFDFAEFKGGRSKKIKFRISEDAQRTLTRADGMRVTVVVKARYGAGKPGTVRVRAQLEP